MANQIIKRKRISLLFIVCLLIMILFFLWFRPKSRIQRRIKEANKLVLEHDYQNAIRLYGEALDINESAVPAIEGLVQVYLEKQNFDAAKVMLNQLAVYEEVSERYKPLLYTYAMYTNDYALAESLLRSEDAYKPSVEEFADLAKGLREDNYLKQAISVLLQALEEFPDSKDLRILAIDIFYETTQFPELIEVYEASKLEIDDVERLNKLAEAYTAVNNVSDAQIIMEKSLDLDFSQKNIMKTLLETYAKTNQVDAYFDLRKKIKEKGISLPKLSTNMRGNSSEQTRYSGLFAFEGDYLFFSDVRRAGVYRKNKATDSRLDLLINTDATALNAKNNVLYYAKPSANNMFFSYDLNTFKEEIIVEESVHNPLVFASNIYYLDEEDKLCVFNIDTKERVYRSDFKLEAYNFIEKNIYFIAQKDKSLYRLNLEQNTHELLLNGPFGEITSNDENLLFLTLDSDHSIVQYNTLNKTINTIYKEHSSYLNYSDNYLYFVSWTPEKINLETKELSKLASNISHELFIDEHEIYSIEYLNQNYTNYRIFKFNKDGSNWHQFWG